MIVKNEAAIIERCLAAVADHISCWVICDTGSTDNTRDIIRTFFAARGIPGELHEFAFKSFDQARNEALGRARVSNLEYDYLILIDADMEFIVEDADFKSKLTADAYQVIQNSGVSYWNTRLLRREVPAGYVGVTHEYLDIKKGETCQLSGVAFIDHASGANRSGKFARDASLLVSALKVEQNPALRARYTFYLANSLRDNGDYAGALNHYLERSRLGYWQEEVFVSLVEAARMKIALEHPINDVLAVFDKAAAACSTRAEALHDAARFCRNNALYERGYYYAIRGSAISLPRDGLFVSPWIYDYGLLDELSIAAYWSGRYTECIAVCDKLLAKHNLPDHYRPRIEKNRQFALDRLQERSSISEANMSLIRQPAMPEIPHIIHFITGLDDKFGGKEFSFIHAMAIFSALRVNAGFTARVYYEYEPKGPYWDLIKPHVTCVHLTAPREFCGRPIEHFAHRADICRLNILLEHGGIYLDMDTICQKPFAPLLDGSVVMGLEKTSDGTTIGLCNATIIAPANALFLKLWLESYNDFTIWNRFAVQLPMLLAEKHPDLVRIESNTSFFWPPWDELGISALFLEDRVFPEAYSFHLWESKSWEHVKDLDASRVRSIDTTYNRIARQFAAACEPPAALATSLDESILEMTNKNAILAALEAFWHKENLQRRLDIQIEAYWAVKRERSVNPLVKNGEKYFSQSDEDGILLEICRRLNLEKGCIVEFGVGNGLENNSIILLLSGWNVIWIGGENLKIDVPSNCKNLRFYKSWITAENCVSLASDALGVKELSAVNILSVDVDGNDIYLVEKLLEADLRPDVVIIEYNGKFPPPIRWRIRYDANHRWDGSDYQGASLQSFVDVLEKYGYRLVCCSLTGVNAFFVRRDHANHFEDVPTDVNVLFYPADYNWFVQRGHWVSKRTIEAALQS